MTAPTNFDDPASIFDHYGDCLQFGRNGAGVGDALGPVLDAHGTPLPLIMSKKTYRKVTLATLTASSISPNTGYVSANAVLLIQGTGMLAVTSVTFGGVAAKWFRAVSDTQLRCEAWPVINAGAVDVVLTSATGPTGATQTTAPITFTFLKSTINLATIAEYLKGNNPAPTSLNFIRLAHDGNLVFGDGNSGGHMNLWYMTTGGTGTQITSTGGVDGFPPTSHVVSGVVVSPNGGYTVADHHGLSSNLRVSGSFANKEVLVKSYALAGEQAVDPDFQSTFVGPDGLEWYVGGTLPTNTSPVAWIWRWDPLSNVDPEVVQIPGITFRWALNVPGGKILAYDPFNLKMCLVDTDFNVTVLGTLPAPVNFINCGCVQGDGSILVVGIDASNNYYTLRFTLDNVSGASIAAKPSGAVALSPGGCCYGPDGKSYVGGANFAANTDSKLFRFDTNMNLLDTAALTGSASTNATPCFPYDICAGSDGNLYTTIQAQQGASRNGSVMKVGGN